MKFRLKEEIGEKFFENNTTYLKEALTREGIEYEDEADYLIIKKGTIISSEIFNEFIHAGGNRCDIFEYVEVVSEEILKDMYNHHFGKVVGDIGTVGEGLLLTDAPNKITLGINDYTKGGKDYLLDLIRKFEEESEDEEEME